ncbi:hypothetical protein KY385_00250 [Candidatus Parcubacteria bacterium]|nr:hypothetical protein [Candidatus Parcubacteria bacterium]
MNYPGLPVFESVEQIPEVIPAKLWLPENSEVRIVKADIATSSTTSPVEVAYGLYILDAGSFSAERQLVDSYLDDLEDGLEVPDDILENYRGNHMGRIVLKASLDPDRFAPLDLVQAYRREGRFRGYNPDEEAFFMNYVTDWGVLKRD